MQALDILWGETMTSAIVIGMLLAFGILAFVLARLPQPAASITGMMIAAPALIYFANLAVTLSGRQQWGAWFFATLALIILLDEIKRFDRSRQHPSRLN
jgi:hypothetical protein